MPFLAALLVSFGALPVSAQSSDQLPREAVAFGYRGGTRIAVLKTNGQWRFDDLSGAYFGEGDVAMIRPVWSPDGRTAYLGMAAPGDGQYRYIYAYDAVSGQLTPVVFLAKGRADYDFAEIQISPDGRYLWINRFGDDSSRLIDTRAPPNKRVLASLDRCLAADGGATWLPGEVRVEGSIACSSIIYLFDLNTGQLVFSYVQTADEVDLTSTEVIVPTMAQPFVLATGGDSTLNKLSLATGRAEKWLEDIEWLLVSKDNQSATFLHADHLFMLDLATLATTDLGTIGLVEGAFETDDSLNYWTVDSYPSPHVIHRVTVQATKRADSTIYDGQASDLRDLQFAPDGHGWLFDFGEAGGYALYNAVGVQTWRSRDQTFPGNTHAVFERFRQFEGWTGDWYHWLIDTDSSGGSGEYSFAVNATTGKVLFAPVQTPYWLSASPDGVWWLYSSLSCDDPDKDSLGAYNVETGALVTLARGGAKHQCDAGFEEAEFYAWAPPFK
jgi:hypothetical protein